MLINFLAHSPFYLLVFFLGSLTTTAKKYYASTNLHKHNRCGQIAARKDWKRWLKKKLHLKSLVNSTSHFDSIKFGDRIRSFKTEKRMHKICCKYNNEFSCCRHHENFFASVGANRNDPFLIKNRCQKIYVFFSHQTNTQFRDIFAHG